MATFNLRRFASPDALKNIKEDHLRDFLLRHESYFSKRGVNLKRSSTSGRGERGKREGDENGLDYSTLAAVLITPDDNTPPKLVNALYMIHEMATPEGMEALLDALKALPPKDRISIENASDITPADLAVQVWLKDQDLLERQHAEQFVTEKASFEYFLSEKAPQGQFSVPSRAKVTALETDLGEWFASKKKGEVVQVFIFPKPDETWFLVRHGETFRREGAVKGGQSATVFYRPEKHDVLVYNSVIGELGINAGSKGEKELYRKAFGRHLFSGNDHFPRSNRKYTLEPLQTSGDASLVCTDIQGIDSIQLTEIMYFWGGAQNEIEIRRSGDIFASLKDRNRKIQKTPISAKFRVKFSDSKIPRSVQIRPPNVAKFTRDDDGRLVAEWLTKRGFSLTKR